MPDRTQLLLNESQEGALIPDWEDVENFGVNAQYDGVITNQAGNVLAGRDAYSDASGRLTVRAPKVRMASDWSISIA